MPKHVRVLLRVVAIRVLLVAIAAQLRARRLARGPETCPVSSNRIAPDTVTVRPSTFRVLVFIRHAGYEHRSIPAAIAAIHTLGARAGFTTLPAEDPGVFADKVLRSFAAVIFVNTTGDILDTAQKAAVERYIRAGGGFVGVHSAMDTEHGWAWYHRLLGADFLRHPRVQPATLLLANPSDPLSPAAPRPWRRTDEWYDFRATPESVTVLVRVDETTYRGGGMGESHPVSWYHPFDGGRAWYTAMGHTTCSYSEEPFLDHLLAGIRYAAGGGAGEADRDRAQP